MFKIVRENDDWEKLIDNDGIACDCDILGMCFWEYLRDDVTYEELKECAQKVKDTYEKYMNGGE